MNREEKLAAAKRKLRQFKQKRTKEPKAVQASKPNDQEKNQRENSVEAKPFDINKLNSYASAASEEPASNTEVVLKNTFPESIVVHENGFTAEGKELESTSLNASFDSDHVLEKDTSISTASSKLDTNATEKSINVDEMPQTMTSNGHVSTSEHLDSGTTTETLLQISTKLNGIAAEVDNVMQHGNGDVEENQYVLSELESRNRQLAEQLASIKRQKQELSMQVEKLNQQMIELQTRMESEKKHIHDQGVQEQTMLKQQIQVQMQTIGILVAEKQEMQHQVHEARTSANHDEHTRQRCQDELQDAKVKIQALNREITQKSDLVEVLSSSKADLESEHKKLQLELSRQKKSKDDSSMHVTELAQKLTAKESECAQLSSEVGDLHEKLAMAEVLLQQLSSPTGETAEDQVSQLQGERENLNQKLIEVKVALDLYQQAFEQLTSEREQLSRQYEDVNQQMQHQVAELSEQVDVLENEKSSLLSEQQSLTLKIQQLETDRKDVVNVQQTQTSPSDDLHVKIEMLQTNFSKISEERDDLLQKLNTQLRNNERLARLNEEQELQLIELNETLSNTNVSAEEHARLLEQSQNDKSTISRALLQNKQLKQQLEEMHDGFIKLSNDKMELATKLSTQSHSGNETKEENERYKVLLSEMKLELESKNRSLIEMQNAIMETQSNNAELQESQHESQNDTINEEIKALEDTISLLSEQNMQLKEMVSQLQNKVDMKDLEIKNLSETLPVSPSADHSGAQMDVSLEVLQQENKTLLQKVENQKLENQKLSQSLLQSESPSSESVISQEEHDSLAKNMSLLQERFSKVMTEKVDALNKIEDLEHINLQLQNECDTIGEYITLYHNQRQLLKQRHHEKDEYVSSIAQEREQMQNKLDKLQTLVLTLVNSKQQSSTDSPHHQQSSTPHKTAGSEEHFNDTFSSELSVITPHDWPDMLEEDEVKHRLKSRPDILPANASLPADEHNAGDNRQNSSESYPGKSLRLSEESPTEEKNAATEIISLLEQIQKPSYVSQKDRPQGFCLKYMGQYTAI
uniref:Golgin subfamily A member 2-like n=1 Tax=Phallusia mammillata TaxID=59560 RepID=A0A6F9DDA2_9ASCI|nr:golgin subfamily A member 2-like [Phallusia mammillata]